MRENWIHGALFVADQTPFFPVKFSEISPDGVHMGSHDISTQSPSSFLSRQKRKKGGFLWPFAVGFLLRCDGDLFGDGYIWAPLTMGCGWWRSDGWPPFFRWIKLGHAAWKITWWKEFLPKKKRLKAAMYMDISKNRGIPKSSSLIGFSLINYKPSILVYPYFGKHPYSPVTFFSWPFFGGLEIGKQSNLHFWENTQPTNVQKQVSAWICVCF